MSGNIPKGDARLTANINQELHMRLKLEATKRRTTMGRLIELLIEKHINNI